MRGGRRESNIPTTTTLMITDKHILVLFSYLYNDVDTPSDRYIAQVCEHTLVIETVKYPTARNRVPWYDHESHEKWSITIKSGERVSNEIDRQKRRLEYRDYKACKQRKQRRFRWKWTDDTGHAYFNSRVDLKNNRIDKWCSNNSKLLIISLMEVIHAKNFTLTLNVETVAFNFSLNMMPIIMTS